MNTLVHLLRCLHLLNLLVVGLSASIALAQTASPPDGATLYLPAVMGPPPAKVLIAAAYIDSAVSYEPDEAILLWNVGGSAQPLAGWSLRTGGREASFASTSALQLRPGERLWCTANTNSFRLSFGEEARCAWSSADNEAELLSAGLTLNNNGGVLALLDERRRMVDAMLYGASTQAADGWLGPPATAYTRGLATAAGQVWRRKVDPLSGLPIDNDVASDWAGDLTDLAWGRRVYQPGWGGWSHEDGLLPWHGVDNASWEVAVGPEGLYAPMLRFLESATGSLDLSLYTLEHPSLAAALAAAAQRGVRVRIMLDGAPPGGITNLQKWCVRQIAEAGGEVYYMAVADSAPKGYKRRYRYLHAKYGIADESRVFVGTENLTLNAMPEPAETPLGGRRGFYLFTDASGVVAALRTLFDLDWRPTTFADLRPYEATHPKFGAPPSDFTLPPPPLFPVAEAPFVDSVRASGHISFVVASAPENAMRPDTGIQALLQRA
ncbi:MAG: phospholipase D-like domain-containing protein, partial [Caldilinea sp.]|nr:phospholipase D-like domain-containing protein [Caldilinea sp.]MDW8442508.1 phospholipase D-like domain-containing protein [Caldilineaceae bacterium]